MELVPNSSCSPIRPVPDDDLHPPNAAPARRRNMRMEQEYTDGAGDYSISRWESSIVKNSIPGSATGSFEEGARAGRMKRRAVRIQ